MALLADICSRHSRHLTLYVSGHCGRNAPEFIKSSFTLERATTETFRQNLIERKKWRFRPMYVYNLVFPMYIYNISLYIIGVSFSQTFIIVLCVHPAKKLDNLQSLFHSSRSPSRCQCKPAGAPIVSCMGSRSPSLDD